MFIILGCLCLGLLFILYTTLDKAMSKGKNIFEKYNIWLMGLIIVNILILLIIMIFVLYRTLYKKKGSEGLKGETGERGNIGDECKIKALNEECKIKALNEEYKIKPLTKKSCTFDRNQSKALSGYNDEHLKSVTRNDCKKACCKRDWCKSFDYYNKTNECDLSKAVASEVGGLYNSKGIYDHYSLPQQQKKWNSYLGKDITIQTFNKPDSRIGFNQANDCLTNWRNTNEYI